MSIFTIKTTELSRNGTRWMVNFETDAMSVAQLYERLLEDKVVFGQSLRAKPTEERGVLEVTERRDILLGREAVYSIEVPNRTFVEYDRETVA